jgi:hypothetical protein
MPGSNGKRSQGDLHNSSSLVFSSKLQYWLDTQTAKNDRPRHV